MDDKLISIVVPIYNVEKYLDQCIQSLCAQKEECLEIILVDDGSTDSSGKICDKYAKLDSRVKVIHQKNGGNVNARKTGFSQATGEYITSVDGDDWIDSNRYQKVIDIIKLNHPDLINMEGFKRIQPSGKVLLCGNSEISEYIYKDNELQDFYRILFEKEKPFKRISFSFWNMIVKKNIALQVVNSIPEEIFLCEDLLFCLRCFINATSVVTLPDFGYNYRLHEN
ncbi:MAG: glycosyltransferase, partial [Treponema sp.]|nr:glycosyltransferase [Treponema sp.]